MVDRIASGKAQSKSVHRYIVKVLRRLEGGARGTLPVKGKCGVGRMQVPYELMEELVKDDLVSFRPIDKKGEDAPGPVYGG